MEKHQIGTIHYEALGGKHGDKSVRDTVYAGKLGFSGDMSHASIIKEAQRYFRVWYPKSKVSRVELHEVTENNGRKHYSYPIKSHA